MKSLALALCLILLWGSVPAATVYKVVRPDGTVLFTDSPQPGDDAEPVEVGPINTVPSLGSPRDAFDDTPAAPRGQGYVEVRIVRPENAATIRDNAGNVNVDVHVSPDLRQGDKIELKLDGQTVGGGNKTAFTLTRMDRGSHSLQAVIKDAAGQVVARSESITFTLQRRSAILQPRPPRPAPSGGG